jgi:pyruvate,water dikinase
MHYVKRFQEIGIDDVPAVGGKNASLGEMYRTLTDQGLRIPNGFAITAEAYRHYIRHNDLQTRISEVLADLDIEDLAALRTTGAKLRQWIIRGEMPADLAQDIRQAYAELAEQYGPSPDVAVRSSATAEDLPTASFAGQQETFLNIRGGDNLLASCKRVFASLFTDRAISYRVDQGFDHLAVALSIGVQKMVRADVATGGGAAGVMFSIDTETGFRDVVFITAAYGLGENVVQGAVTPDEYLVFKPTLNSGHRPILRRQLGDKAMRMIYSSDAMAGVSTTNVVVPAAERARFALSDDEVLELARAAVAIEAHYSRRAGHDQPMDMEWAKDGQTGELFILQARPETVQARRRSDAWEQFKLESRGPVLATGKSVGNKIASGKARVILGPEDMQSLVPGEVLVTDITDPDWEPIMKIAAAIVTNRGGRTCHAAIVARELGIPAVVGTGDASQHIQTGQTVTVSCAEGDTGLVFEGEQAFTREAVDLATLPNPRTRIMLNVGNPEMAFEAAQLPTHGVGLARLEFIINHSIGIHPRALLELDTLEPALQRQIRARIAGYPGPKEFYIQRLAEGVGTIAAAFYPRPVIVRLSDFKSNEYAALLGGEGFEPREENPMIGFRGAFRYPSEAFAPCFALECAAMRVVRDEQGLDNVALMIPFVRSLDEGLKTLELLAANGLRRGDQGLKVYLMCEIPANALLADDFLAHFDGFSIGSNDLTQLTLGVDRDSSLLTGLDERNPAVLKLMEMAIAACRRHDKYVGICGQAPSDYPEITRWLVTQGIESISLNADSVITMTQVVHDAEQAASD